MTISSFEICTIITFAIIAISIFVLILCAILFNEQDVLWCFCITVLCTVLITLLVINYSNTLKDVQTNGFETPDTAQTANISESR